MLLLLLLYKYKRSDNKVRELAAVCLPWHQWTETSVWLDDVGISAFHSCVVVDLRQSLSEWRQLLSVFWCAVTRNVGPSFQTWQEWNLIRGMLLQVYGDNAMKITAVYKWVTRLSERRESVTDKEIRTASKEQN
jgi:hypothetical protein